MCFLDFAGTLTERPLVERARAMSPDRAKALSYLRKDDVETDIGR